MEILERIKILIDNEINSTNINCHTFVNAVIEGYYGSQEQASYEYFINFYPKAGSMYRDPEEFTSLYDALPYLNRFLITYHIESKDMSDFFIHSGIIAPPEIQCSLSGMDSCIVMEREGSIHNARRKDDIGSGVRITTLKTVLDSGYRENRVVYYVWKR